ncbi:trichohyalin-like isoform X2 [Ruditapes philippinarum]|nr:trichohyalin-like isoform X2 [Ruditapes philippinarum]
MHFTTKGKCRAHLIEQHSKINFKCTRCGKVFLRNTPGQSCHTRREDFIRFHTTTGQRGAEAEACLQDFIKKIDELIIDNRYNKENHSPTKRIATRPQLYIRKRKNDFVTPNEKRVRSKSPSSSRSSSSSSATSTTSSSSSSSTSSSTRSSEIEMATLEALVVGEICDENNTIEISEREKQRRKRENERRISEMRQKEREEIRMATDVIEKELRTDEREENEQKEKEKREKLEKERLEKERLENERKERLENDRLERERLENERKEKERLENEKLDRERKEKERIENEKLEREREEKERIENEKLEREREEKERLENERREKEEKERLDNEQKEKEKREKLERERKEKIMTKKRVEKTVENKETEKTEKEMKKKLEEIKHQEIIILNVGGIKYSTTRGTLCAEESLLKNIAIQIDNEEIYIDRDSKNFRTILQHLRYTRQGELTPASLLPNNKIELKELILECKYYGLLKLLKIATEKREKLIGLF